MSKYTTELRFICENYAGLSESKGYTSTDEIIKKAIPRLFDFKFPLYDERRREELCFKIIDTYYTREIGFETVGLFKQKLRAKLNNIMPYYNKLYAEWAREFDLFNDVDLTREHTLNRADESQATTASQAESQGTDKSRFSDTPQGGLDGIESNAYLTNASIDDSTSTTSGQTTSKTSGTSLDTYSERVKGKQGGGSYAELLEKYRQSLINIDLMIIEELNNLFMLIW